PPHPAPLPPPPPQPPPPPPQGPPPPPPPPPWPPAPIAVEPMPNAATAANVMSVLRIITIPPIELDRCGRVATYIDVATIITLSVVKRCRRENITSWRARNSS